MTEQIPQYETHSGNSIQAPSELSISGNPVYDLQVSMPVESGVIPASANDNPSSAIHASSTNMNNQRTSSMYIPVTSFPPVRIAPEKRPTVQPLVHRSGGGGHPKNAQILIQRDSNRQYISPGPRMEFINLSTTYKHDKTTKKKVRRHVKGEHDRQKLERSTREKTLQTKSKALLPRFGSIVAAPLSPGLAVSDLDPFRKFPITMTAQTHRLLRNVYSDSTLIFTTLRDRGFFNNIMDPVTFTQLLAMSSWEIAQESDGDRTESMKLSVTAIQSLNKRLSGPVIDTSDEMVLSLLIFCLYEWVKNDLKAFTMHVNGLARLVLLRGGLKSLQHDLIIQGLVGRVDMMQALIWGTRPNFPQNQEAFDSRTRNQSYFLTDKATIPDTYIISTTKSCFEILDHVRTITMEQIEHQRGLSQANKDLQINDDNLWTPFKEQITKIEEDPYLDACQNDLLSVCKIGCLLFISRIQQFLTPSSFTDPRIDEHLTQEIIALTSKSVPIIFISNAIPIQHPGGPLMAWILAMSAMGSVQGEQKRWHSVIFAAYRRGLGIRSFDDMLDLLRTFPWIEEVHTPRMREIWPLVGGIFAYRG